MTMLALLGPLPAQPPPLALGQRVRVVSLPDSTVHTGRLALVVADTVVLDDGHRVVGHVRYLALGGRGRVEVPTRLRSHPVEGAFFGTLVGMLAGHVSWAEAGMFTGGCLTCANAPHQLIGHGGRVLLGGLVGLGLGAFVGAHVYTTRWDLVPRDQVDLLRAATAPRPMGRVLLGASLGF